MGTRLLRNSEQRGMTVIGMLLLLIVIAFAALIAMKVVPMYIEYYTIKSTIESIRKEPQLAQMSPADIHNAIQKRFDIGYVERLNARDLKIRMMLRAGAGCWSWFTRMNGNCSTDCTSC
jgi:Tfp pilus assembly major pilin PilA